MASKFKEAIRRLFGGVFVCRRCKSKIKSNVNKIMNQEVKCRRCGGRAFRPIKRTK